MPGVRSVSKDLTYAPIPVDRDMVREGLLRYGTTCEYDSLCTVQAVAVYLGTRAVAYLCQRHFDLVDGNAQLSLSLERRIFDLFNNMFNIFRVNERMGGTFSTTVKQQQDDAKRADKVEERDLRRGQRQAVKDMNRNVKVGAPDRWLAQARTRAAQSPLQDELIQPLIWNPNSDELI